jgi:hypothetical protein
MSREVESEAGKVQFLQHHRPGLTPGDYTIAVDQVVKIEPLPARERPANTSTYIAEQKFSVAGERFELKPTDVQAVFPPDGNLGDHSNVFPHIILDRSTLPWERVAEVESAKPTVPWLALLLFDADEKPKVQNVTLAQLKVAGAEKFQPLPLILEKGQHDNDVVTVIDVPASRLKKIMPTAQELALLAHVRFRIPPESNEEEKEEKSKPEEIAVVISNRLPQPGKTSFAYLVSLEKRLRNGILEGVDRDGLIRLVSLQSWSFACESPRKDFKELLRDLNKASGPPATLRLPRISSASERLEPLLSKGYVLLPHYFRHGDRTASWFHGPFISGEYTNPKMDLPVRTADELVRYDPELSMFDVSYAAAWELGRLLALQDKDFSTNLYKWKRELAQGVAQLRQRLTRLPFQKTMLASDPPEPVAKWFDSLRTLEGVPFNYLVPDERMLPSESIRFFRVDQTWVDCLADGAYSIGRVSSSDHAADKLHGKKTLAANLGEPRTGFLLRSEVVSGWPALLVDAYTDRNKRSGEKTLDVVRIDRLDAGVLLCVFKGDIGRVEIYQNPEALHFGLNVEGSGFSKVLRNPDSGELLKDKVNLEPRHWRSDSPRTANISVLADSLKQSATFTSSQFALQMVEGAEKVIFRVR